MTDQQEAGCLSLHRPLRHGDATAWFDQIHGYGWRLVTMSPVPLENLLEADAREFFVDNLAGKCVNIRPDEDVSGEYEQWFQRDLGQDHVVLIRPDFYIFGHTEVADVNMLVRQLQSKMRLAAA